MTQEIQSSESRADTPVDLERAFDEMRAGFLDAFGIVPFGPWSVGELRDGNFLRPARTDVSDTGKAYKIVAEVPGIPKENIDIRIRGSNVEIRGELVTSSEKNGSEYVHRERRSSGYFRSLELPEPVVAEEAKARVQNGLLELELPKRTPSPSTEEIRVAVQ
jgi:HSP20 family protein